MKAPMDNRFNAPTPKMPIGKVMVVNFAVMVSYMALVSLQETEPKWAVWVKDAFLVLTQVGINMLAGLVILFTHDSKVHTENRKQLGSALLLGGFIMAVIGFGSCIAHTTLLDS